MERTANRMVSPVALIVVMAAFLSALFMADANPSQAASGKRKSAEVTKTAVQYTEGRIKELKGALRITEDQELLWDNVARVMRANAQDLDAMSLERSEKAQTMNAVEQVKFHSQVTEAQLNQQKKFIPPFEALYASLSDEQKATIDTLFRTGKHGKHRIR